MIHLGQTYESSSFEGYVTPRTSAERVKPRKSLHIVAVVPTISLFATSQGRQD